MFSCETYRAAYGWEPREILPGWPPLYRLRRPLRPAILSHAPYVTDVALTDDAALDRYVDAADTLVQAERAAYALLKLHRAPTGERLRSALILDRSFGKAVFDLRPDRDRIFAQMISSKVRNHIRRGQQLGAELLVGGVELLDDFYDVMLTTQTDLGTPVHTRRFYDAILQHTPDTELLVARYQGQPIAAALLVVRGSVLYHPYAGTKNAFKPTSINSALYWRIIEIGKERGCQTWDMGRSVRGSGNEHFKLSWGARPVELVYAYLSGRGDPPNFHSRWVSVATRAWRHMPKALAQALGPVLIQTIP